ncbi:MAG: histidine kinase [Tannerellaceae bacterium]|nr:histidine kinase [Tannerellaceae bacterium]
MAIAKKNDWLVGLIISILLTVFVNFSLLMRLYEYSSKVGIDPFRPPVNSYYLYFSLGWFFLFAFILFILTLQWCRLGDQLFKRNEYKVVLFVIGVSALCAFLLLQLYPVLQETFMEHVVQTEGQIKPSGGMKPDGNFGRGGPSKKPMWEMPDSPIPFIKAMSPHPFSRPLVTEHLFVLITIILIISLMRLLYDRQQMLLEFEKLKTEKLKTFYNALMGQINPHFFFNSLNGLNSLIRGDEKKKTLAYLDGLSNVFRYILQSNKKELVTLEEELQFVKAYTYLLSVRYEGKLFFFVQSDTRYLLWQLPILSILPLIENAVKHNVISKQYPLEVNIYTTEDHMLVVSNKVQPKVEKSVSSGIGLKNLWGRYRMLTGKDIYISNRKDYFKVSLSLINASV